MAKASNLLVKEAPQHKVLKKLRVKNKATQLTVAPDVNKPGDYVIKVTFKSKADAAAFMKKHHRSFQQAPYTENNGRTIVMGPKRANSVFKSLGAKKHNMFKDLVDQHKQASQKQAMTPRSR